MSETHTLGALVDNMRTALDQIADVSLAGPSTLPHAAWLKLRDIAAQDLHGALDIDLLDALASGWSKARELESYTDRQEYPPSRTVKTTLAHHEVRIRIDPELCLTIDGVQAGKLLLGIEFVVGVNLAVLTIRSGAITAIETGALDIAATLTCGNSAVPLTTKSASLTFPGTRTLAKPVPIPPFFRRNRDAVA